MTRKKTRNTSARAAKVRRQTNALATRRRPQLRTDLDGILNAFAEAVAAGAFELAGPNGTPYTATLEDISAYTNAELADDGEPPAGMAEVLQLFADDIRYGALRLRLDGLWESDNDYRPAKGATA
ncbi:MAG: hypothetical protein HOY76_01665 [Streptomyces sp.]|nr:hypothetical protein [Streptomyces sp.]